MSEGKTQQETIHLTALALGISELEADFIIAIEQGEITGDVNVLGTTPNTMPHRTHRSSSHEANDAETVEHTEV